MELSLERLETVEAPVDDLAAGIIWGFVFTAGIYVGLAIAT